MPIKHELSKVFEKPDKRVHSVQLLCGALVFSHIIRIISKMDKIVNEIDGVKNGSVGAGRGGGLLL